MYCGIVVRGKKGEKCGLAFMERDAGVTTVSLERDEHIMRELQQRRPDIIVMNAPARRPGSGEFREGEKELIEEGYSMLPQGMRDRKLLERAEFLTNSIERSGIGATVLESEPTLVGRMMDVSGDEDLEEMGIETRGVENVWEFDALVLALMGRRFSEDRYEDRGLIVPELSGE